MSLRARSAWAPLCLGLALALPARADVTSPFPGVTLVHHPGQSALAIIDLCAPGVAVRATRFDERKGTPQEFAQKLDLEVAINADFFEFPGWSFVVGRARGDNQEWPPKSQQLEVRPYWQFGAGFAAGVANGAEAPSPKAREIVGGHNVLVQNAKSTGPWAPQNDGALLNSTHRRTGVGLSADRRTLYLMAVNASINCQTLADWMIQHAAEAKAPPIDFITNMDGGGSSQMYVKGKGQIITSGRQVGNHIGIQANGNGAPESCIPRFAAEYVAQSHPLAHVAPLVLTVGETVDGWIDFKNIGTDKWPAGATRLAPTPRDQPSQVAGPGWIAPHRVSSLAKEVAPGQTGRFALPITGKAPVDYTQFFGLLVEGVTWFADPPLGGGPPDKLIAVHVLVKPAPAMDGAVPADLAPGAGDAAARDSGKATDGGEVQKVEDGGDAGDGVLTEGGCSCAVGRSRGSGWGWLGLIFLLTRRQVGDGPGMRPLGGH
ncbi:MAG: hypothetical protein EXR72_13435 [Myxococcales bacterium]|nr:hypothetical protein [Myxococcales bacterium]